jgi:DegV family protein with EDD domain
MKIVSDRAMDMAPEQMAGLEIQLAPLLLTLEGQTYRSGVDIQPSEFYERLAASASFPTTSQPSAGDFAAIYRQVAQTDPDILSIHISSGLSGTCNSARAAAEMVPEAHVTIFDSKTLSVAEGWQVEAAVRAARAGWSLERTLNLLERVRDATQTFFTVATLRYLIHGGRISHIKGLLASMLNIKPVIAVEKERGIYVQVGQARTLSKAIQCMAELVAGQHTPGSALRVQVPHANNPEGAAMLRALLDQRFTCTWLPSGPIAPVLGAHTGAGLVGVAFAPQEIFSGEPWE